VYHHNYLAFESLFLFRMKSSYNKKAPRARSAVTVVEVVYLIYDLSVTLVKSISFILVGILK